MIYMSWVLFQACPLIYMNFKQKEQFFNDLLKFGVLLSVGTSRVRLVGEESLGLSRGRKDLEGLLPSVPQHPSKELIGGGDLHLRLTQSSSHMPTDICVIFFFCCIG